MKSEKQLILKQIEKSRDEYIRFTQEFIRYPSVSKSEKDAQMYYARLLESLSLSVDVWEPTIADTAINPYYLGERSDFAGSPNVVGVLKGSGGGQSLIINGHVDVVPEGTADWLDAPYSGKYEDGRIYGRGASDMKGGLMAAALAVKAVRDAGIALKGDVIVQSVIEEESGGAGSLSAIARGYRADAAIVPEPTDLIICPVSVGAMWFRVRVKGLSAHGATAHLGVNAIEKAMKIMAALSDLDKRRGEEKRHPLYKDKGNPASVNIGTIQGGVFPTNVPEQAVMEGRMGIAPGEEVAEARKALEEAVASTASKDEWLKNNRPEVEWYGFCFGSNNVDPEHAIVRLLAENLSAVTNQTSIIGGTPWGTDAAALNKFGGVPAVVFGPGPGGMAHKANEYLDVEQFMTTITTLAFTILDWCGLS